MSDPELDAMVAINQAMTTIEDPEVKRRVLRWANDKFGFLQASEKAQPKAKVSSPTAAPTVEGNEIPGIAIMTESGELNLTVRDLKAKSANDAAVRLVHIAIRAHQRLSGLKTTSSKNILVPLLKGWRVYDGNTRRVIAAHKGLVRNGDEMSLDFHAQGDADRYMDEVLDESVTGTWKPSGKGTKRKNSED